MSYLSSSIRSAFFITFFAFLFLFVFTKAFGPIPFSINSITTTKTDLFTVSGDGEVTAVPDTAQINLGVTETAPTVESAINKVNEITNSIIADLKELGVEEKNMKTTNFSINPNYDYSRGSKNEIVSYSVTQNLRLEIKPIAKANQAIDMATKNGANMVGSIQFTVDDDKKLEIENKARENAIRKAKSKAESIAKASGIRLGKIVNVMESGPAYRNYAPAAFDMKAAGNAESAPTQLQPGENTYTASVTLSYETY